MILVVRLSIFDWILSCVLLLSLALDTCLNLCMYKHLYSTHTSTYVAHTQALMWHTHKHLCGTHTSTYVAHTQALMWHTHKHLCGTHTSTYVAHTQALTYNQKYTCMYVCTESFKHTHKYMYVCTHRETHRGQTFLIGVQGCRKAVVKGMKRSNKHTQNTYVRTCMYVCTNILTRSHTHT